MGRGRLYIRFSAQLGKRRAVGFSNFRRDHMDRTIELVLPIGEFSLI